MKFKTITAKKTDNPFDGKTSKEIFEIIKPHLSTAVSLSKEELLSQKVKK
jgi:hypothetical protein